MRLVATLDLDDPKAEPVRWAVALAQAMGAGLEIVHVMDRAPGEGSLQWLRARRPDAVTRLVEEARALVRQHLQGVEGLGEGVEVSVLAGPAPRMLAEWVRAVEDGVLVVGPGHRRRLQGLIGTTTDRLLRVSTRPVLVARGQHTGTVSQVLASVDLDETSSRVGAEAARWAARLGARLTLHHVPQPRWSNAFLEGRGEHELDEMFENPDEMRERARAGLQRLSEQIEREGLTVETEVGEPGADPAGAVAERVEQGDVDMVVTGTHGMSAVDRMILGSVAEEVVQRAPGPVLVVPAGH